jgi:hypothetical protein
MTLGIGKIVSGGGTTKPASWGVDFPGRGGDTGKEAFFLRMEGLNAWLRSMEEDWREAKEAAEEALRLSLERRVIRPSLRLCPIDTGALRASAWADASYRGGYLQGACGYDTDYALWVHEIPAAHKSPTQWKFLEEPFSLNAHLVAEDVLAAIRAEFD